MNLISPKSICYSYITSSFIELTIFISLINSPRIVETLRKLMKNLMTYHNCTSNLFFNLDDSTKYSLGILKLNQMNVKKIMTMRTD